MIARASRFKSLAVCVVVTVACSHPPVAAKPPVPASSFAAAIEAAGKRAEVGDYAGVDRILSDFAVANENTPEAREVAFWRALYMVDPSNKNASVAEGLRAIDIYLATPGNKWYRPQAQVVKRIASTMQNMRTAKAVTRVVGRDTVFVTREDEITALKDQLAKANAELDRIKKRLANPSR
ncbi:MAG: hypothetical protein ABIZ36_04625 [Gemmatimonadaceae bacterium]